MCCRERNLETVLPDEQLQKEKAKEGKIIPGCIFACIHIKEIFIEMIFLFIFQPRHITHFLTQLVDVLCPPTHTHTQNLEYNVKTKQMKQIPSDFSRTEEEIGKKCLWKVCWITTYR